MFVKVAQLYEGGRPLPKHRSIRTQPTMIGQLRLTEEYSREFRRNIVYAVLHTSSGADLIPRLHDAVVRYIADGCMTITGFEQMNSRNVAKASLGLFKHTWTMTPHKTNICATTGD